MSAGLGEGTNFSRPRSSLRRLLAVAGLELRTQLASPLFWTLLVVAALATVSLNPAAMIGSGDSSVGGLRPYVNSRYAMAQVFALGGILFYVFFAALLAGMSVVRDDEARISVLLHSTPLTPREYVAGKMAGALGALGLAFGAHALFAIVYFELAPIASLSELRGPFGLGHYLVPILLFAVPQAVLAAGLAFFVGERTRRPMLVYLVPIALVIVTLFVLVGWSAESLPPALDRLFVLLDPSGLRWLRQTVFGVDRGVAFYNTAPFHFDLTFWLNRLLTLALPLAALARTALRFRVNGPVDGAFRGWRLRRDGMRGAGARPTASSARPVTPLRELRMASSTPGFLASAGVVARAELRELAGQPATYLFGALVVSTVLEFAASPNEIFGAPAILTAGTMAVGAVEVVTLLLCLLTLFTLVEAATRETRARLAAILYATPLRTGALLLGKGLASAVLAASLLAVSLVASLAILTFQGRGGVDPGPFLLIWGVILGPTFLAWGTFTLAILSGLRDRYATYAVGLLALLATALGTLGGGLSWPWNWPLWGTLRWSDLGSFDLEAEPLLWNRLMLLGFALLFGVLAARLFPRRESDAVAALGRLRPRALAGSAFRLAPFALPPLLIAGSLAFAVHRGYEGGEARRAAEAYRLRNFATWSGTVPPTLTRMDLVVDLEPAERSVRVVGRYRLVNRTGEAMDRLPLTAGPGFEKVSWTLNGARAVSEDRAGLHLLRPARPLAPGGEIEVGFAHRAVVPRGFGRGSGELSQMVLPSGVALDSLEPSFLPIPGFLEDIGVSARDRFAQRDLPPDLWLRTLPPVIGNAVPFHARMEVSVPRGYTVNAVGRRLGVRTEGGRTTSLWETDAPVRVLNLIAGRWDVVRGPGVEVYHHPGHRENAEEIAGTLAAARRRYSEWFGPYPWKELRLSEVPARVGRARGFPTNILFAEGFGFLTRSEPRTRLASVVTAHEAAHQWWGNLLVPGDGPGADVLIEGMANYSTLLLMEAEHGASARVELARRLEERYGADRRVDGERPLVEIRDGARAGDETAISDKGAWVFWMIDRQLGRERMLAGLRAFLHQFSTGDDHPLLQDLLASLRPFAPDPQAFDAFAAQWLSGVVLPEIRLSEPRVDRVGEGWRVSVLAENVGTGRIELEIAATRGERPETEGKAPGAAYAESRISLRLFPRRPQRVAWTVPFPPERLVADPDVQLLQLNRSRATVRLRTPPTRGR